MSKKTIKCKSCKKGDVKVDSARVKERGDEGEKEYYTYGKCSNPFCRHHYRISFLDYNLTRIKTVEVI